MGIISFRDMRVVDPCHCIHKLWRSKTGSSLVSFSSQSCLRYSGFTKIMRQWIGVTFGRVRFPPHMKCYFRSIIESYRYHWLLLDMESEKNWCHVTKPQWHHVRRPSCSSANMLISGEWKWFISRPKEAKGGKSSRRGGDWITLVSSDVSKFESSCVGSITGFCCWLATSHSPIQRKMVNNSTSSRMRWEYFSYRHFSLMLLSGSYVSSSLLMLLDRFLVLRFTQNLAYLEILLSLWLLNAPLASFRVTIATHLWTDYLFRFHSGCLHQSTNQVI